MADYDLKSITADTDGPSADTELLFGSPDQSSGTPKPYSFAGIKTWIKAWIVKGDVGLGNVSNNAQLTIANNLSDVASALTSRANLAVSKSHPGYLTGKYYLPQSIFTGNSGTASASGRLQLVPFYVPRTVTIDRFFTRISTGSAGNWQGGVYNASASTLMPTTLVGNGGSAATNSSSTATESLLSGGSGSNITLNEGSLYWLGVNVDNASATFPIVTQSIVAQSLIGDTTNTNIIAGGATVLIGYYTAMAFGTWTADITGNGYTAAISGTNIPAIGFKVA